MICYGIDEKKDINPLMVRDAITECFYLAHKEILDSEREEKKDEATEKIEVKQLIKNIFEKAGADFDNPKKKDLYKVVEELKEYAGNFRDPKIITKHEQEITKLIDKIKD